MAENRCVITGLGVISAIGHNVPECWENILASKSGIDHTRTLDTENCYADFAAEVRTARPRSASRRPTKPCMMPDCPGSAEIRASASSWAAVSAAAEAWSPITAAENSRRMY